MIMKKVWKWVIGIVIGLIVIGAVVGIIFMVQSHWFARGEVNGAIIPGYTYRHQGLIPDDENGRGMYFYNMGGPGMMRFGRMPFGGLMMLFPLGFLFLMILGIIWLIKAIRKPETAPVAMHACKNCGNQVQDNWKNCPHCGRKQ
jgi:hypothetical protein